EEDSGGRRHQQAWLIVSARSRYRQADLRRGGTARASERSPARTRVEDTALSPQAGTARANDDEAGGRGDGHPGTRSRVPETDGGCADGRSLSATSLQAPACAVSWQSR